MFTVFFELVGVTTFVLVYTGNSYAVIHGITSEENIDNIRHGSAEVTRIIVMKDGVTYSIKEVQ